MHAVANSCKCFRRQRMLCSHQSSFEVTKVRETVPRRYFSCFTGNMNMFKIPVQQNKITVAIDVNVRQTFCEHVQP